MIIFSSAVQAKVTDNTINILAESELDSNLVNSTTKWVLAPFFAKPVNSEQDWNVDSGTSISEYTSAISDSTIAKESLAALVELSNQGKTVIIACYDYNVAKSHLSTLLDIVEDLFVDQAPELRMEGS